MFRPSIERTENCLTTMLGQEKPGVSNPLRASGREGRGIAGPGAGQVFDEPILRCDSRVRARESMMSRNRTRCGNKDPRRQNSHGRNRGTVTPSESSRPYRPNMRGVAHFLPDRDLAKCSKGSAATGTGLRFNNVNVPGFVLRPPPTACSASWPSEGRSTSMGSRASSCTWSSGTRATTWPARSRRETVTMAVRSKE